MDLTVIYPAYNEARNIRATIERSIVTLRPLFESFEVLIVDDCGQDETGSIANQLAVEFPEVRVIHNEVNLGQGMCLRKGFLEARGNLIIHNAMDYPFDLKNMPRMLDAMMGADIVVAERMHRAGYSPYRRLLSFINVRILNLLFPVRLKDYNFVQLYRRQVLGAVRVRAQSTGFLTPELLIRAFDGGYRVRAVPVEYHPRLQGRSTSGSLKVIVATLRDMARFWVERLRNESGKQRV